MENNLEWLKPVDRVMGRMECEVARQLREQGCGVWQNWRPCEGRVPVEDTDSIPGPQRTAPDSNVGHGV